MRIPYKSKTINTTLWGSTYTTHKKLYVANIGS